MLEIESAKIANYFPIGEGKAVNGFEVSFNP